MNRAVTDGIIRGFTHGLLTSTSLLANAPDASQALKAWRQLEVQRAAGRLPSSAARAGLGDGSLPFELGVHLNLTQGRPLTKTYPAPLLDEEGRFCGIGKLFRHLRRTRPAFESALRSEAAAQIEFLKMRGVHPTHINGHQYIELLPGLRDTLQGLMARYGIDRLRVARERALARTTLFPRLQAANWALAHVKRFYAVRLEREAQAWNVEFPDAFFGTSHAGRVDLPLVRQFLASGRRARLIEIGLHPAVAGVTSDTSADGWSDPLATVRPRELEMLTSPQLVEIIRAHGMSLGRLGGTATVAALRAA
jgi:chitin disaccharide deacetylase